MKYQTIINISMLIWTLLIISIAYIIWKQKRIEEKEEKQHDKRTRK